MSLQAGKGYRNNPNGRPRRNYLEHYTVTKDGCWRWSGATVGVRGYGYIRFPTGAQMAHRYFYEHHIGPIPDGLVLDHLCQNRRCVNPAHLEPVTSRENTMRAETPARINAEKTVCKNGHNKWKHYKAENGRERRYCLVCNSKTGRKHRAELKRRGVKLGRKELVSEDEVETMRKMRKRGVPVAKIAAEYGIKPSTVYARTNRKAA